MSNPYTLTDTLEFDVAYLSAFLREADVAEIRANGTDETIDQVLQRGVDRSEVAWTVLYKGRPCALVGSGLFQDPELDDLGCVWMLGSEDLTAEPRAFVEKCLEHLPDLFIRDTLCNYVWSGNTVHIRFLEWLGAEFDDPIIINGEEFIYFELRNPANV